MERVRWTRLRWRLRGAAQWPVFAVLTAAEGVLLNALPVWGDGPGGIVPGLLIAGFLNLAVVAVVAPVAGWLVRLRRRDLPRAIAKDYAATALLVVLAGGIVWGGLSNHAEVAHDRRARVIQFGAVSGYVAAQAPEYRPGLHSADSLRLDRDLYRTCLPGADPDRPLCLFVDTSQDPPAVTRDHDRLPNGAYRR